MQLLPSSQYTVKSSFSFAKEIPSTTFPHSTFMVSFDVSSLFTNIPLDETVNIVLDSLFSETDVIALVVPLKGLILRNFLNLLSKTITSLVIINCMSRSKA